MENLVDIAISYFSTATDNIPKSTSLLAELNAIKQGKVKDLILKCRAKLSEGNKSEYSALKKNLPSVTFAAEFKGKRAKDNCEHYTGLMILDFDGIDEIGDLKANLTKDKFTFATWISPSGKGLKVLVKVSSDKTTHKFYFDAISDYYQTEYGLETDKSGSDISRLCFTSYDDELFFNANSSIWSEQKLQVTKSKKINDGNPNKEIREHKTTTNPNITEGKNNSKDRALIKKIISHLSRNKKSITSTYDNWYRVAYAITSTFTPEIGIKHFLELCRLDGNAHDEERSCALIEYCYRNNKGEIKFATILHLAQEADFKPN